MAKTWKDHLLRSGLPLEADVRRFLEGRSGVIGGEYTYFRSDEQGVEREFSFDVDATFITDPYFFSLAVECKYRHPSTRWVFTPHRYGALDETFPTDVLHAQDYFIERNFPFRHRPFPVLGPLCASGVEITQSGPNPNAITRAVSQLVYALPEQLAGSCETQLGGGHFADTIFSHVPVVVTTAPLLRLHDDATIADVLGAGDIEDVASSHKVVVLNAGGGAQLKAHAERVYNDFVTRCGRDRLGESLSAFTSDVEHFTSVMVNHYCPSAVVVAQYEHGGGGLAEVLDYLDQIARPPDSLLDALEGDRRRLGQATRRRAKIFDSGQSERPEQD
ncbi:MAG: hypothetical protein AAGI91_09900 [Bacteroidota bacterium]